MENDKKQYDKKQTITPQEKAQISVETVVESLGYNTEKEVDNSRLVEDVLKESGYFDSICTALELDANTKDFDVFLEKLYEVDVNSEAYKDFLAELMIDENECSSPMILLYRYILPKAKRSFIANGVGLPSNSSDSQVTNELVRHFHEKRRNSARMKKLIKFLDEEDKRLNKNESELGQKQEL